MKLLWLSLVILMECTSCKPNRLKVDVSKIFFTLHIDRFEQDLFKVDTSNLRQSTAILEKKYPEFLPLFVENISGLAKAHDSTDMRQIGHFISNKDIINLKHDADSVYPGLDKQKAQLQDAFRHYIYYYPAAKIPRVITFISGFNNAVVNTNTTLAIGLDMFMGASYRFYRSVQFPRYLTRTLSPAYLPVTAFRGFARQIFSEPGAGVNLVGNMIYEGKILYFLDAMFPDQPDSLKISYTGKQLEWCKSNESNIWAYAVENDKLFSSEKKIYENFFSEGPFTQGLAAESAPRLGMYIGREIVRNYMEKHPEISLQQLMAASDYNRILKDSEYKP